MIRSKAAGGWQRRTEVLCQAKHDATSQQVRPGVLEYGKKLGGENIMGGECPRCGAPLEGATCSYCGYVEPQETQNSRMENGYVNPQDVNNNGYANPQGEKRSQSTGDE